MYKRFLLSILFYIVTGFYISGYCQNIKKLVSGNYTFILPEEYLEEREDIPSFWLTSVEEVTNFLVTRVDKGKIEVIGTSAGGCPIRAVLYGKPRQGRGTTTFSGALGCHDMSAYRGSDHYKTVYMGMAAVHGSEFEGIVGIVNLISVIETGKDLRGKAWPEISEVVDQLDRIILIPIMNPDGRERIPLRMEPYRQTDRTVHLFLTSGGSPDGKVIGWPEVKRFIPLDYNKHGFPGGYPNDAGVNFQHDDFFEERQPETQILFELTARERPDLIINMHTGAVYMNLHRPFCEPILTPVFDSLYKSIHTRLSIEGLQETKNLEKEANPGYALGNPDVFNLDGALNLNCGALSVLVESPSHGFSGKNKAKEIAYHTPDMLLDAQLLCHLEAMKFLVKTGGRSKWTNKPSP